ncbi:MAG: tryptophan--tRNA ligase, partial [Planctomycetota bacterium]|nr:tryptophan--tRNA ligase [Planctomycetota bacterium]
MSKNKRKKLISGIQPSGRVHLGNWAGAFQNWLRLQNDPSYDCSFFIADYHSLSGDYDASEKRNQIFEVMVDLLAVGLNPEKCLLFRQSDIAEHTELCWIFNTLTPVSFMERMTQFKDKSGQQDKNINMGLLGYPILQAADILIHKGELVPIGRDQVQHVELTRDIARFFNKKYGVKFFPEAKPLLTDVPKLRSLNNPLKKMSKSLGEKSYIALSDKPEVVLKKIKSAVTNTDGMISMGEDEVEKTLAEPLVGLMDKDKLRGQAGIWNLITLLRLFGKEGEVDRAVTS